MSERKINWLDVFKLSGAYLALMVGSGFATGQEAMQFFVVFGWQAYAIIVVTLLLLGYSARSLMLAGRHHGITTNEETFQHFCGPILGSLLTWYTMIMIVAVTAVMLAGAAATLEQAYKVPHYIGSGLLALLVMATLMLGLRRILDVMAIIGPLLIVLTIIIASFSFVTNADGIDFGARKVHELDVLKATPHWAFAGFVYVGLTLPGVASLLPKIGSTVKSDREITAIALLGPLLIISAMTIVVTALLASIETVYSAEVPILALADSALPVYGSVFAGVIFLGIYTTITPLLWTVCSRFSEEGTTRYRALVVMLATTAFLGATILPFGQLLNIIFPSIGYVGLLILASIVIADLRKIAWFSPFA